VELSAEQAAILDRLMASGHFASESDAVTIGLHALESREADDELPPQDETLVLVYLVQEAGQFVADRDH